jgi:hypothetical protein
MFAIADHAGGTWPERARAAALVLHASRDQADTLSIGVLLLAHIRQAFEDAGADRLSTVDLLRRLVDNEQGPWGRLWGHEVAHELAPQKAASDLARRLRAFGIKPRTIRVGVDTPRGYLLEDFAEPFARYVDPPSEGGATPATATTGLASDVAPVLPVAPPMDGNGRGCPECRGQLGHTLERPRSRLDRSVLGEA